MNLDESSNRHRGDRRRSREHYDRRYDHERSRDRYPPSRQRSPLSDYRGGNDSGRSSKIRMVRVHSRSPQDRRWSGKYSRSRSRSPDLYRKKRSPDGKRKKYKDNYEEFGTDFNIGVISASFVTKAKFYTFGFINLFKIALLKSFGIRTKSESEFILIVSRMGPIRLIPDPKKPKRRKKIKRRKRKRIKRVIEDHPMIENQLIVTGPLVNRGTVHRLQQ